MVRGKLGEIRSRKDRRTEYGVTNFSVSIRGRGDRRSDRGLDNRTLSGEILQIPVKRVLYYVLRAESCVWWFTGSVVCWAPNTSTIDHVPHSSPGGVTPEEGAPTVPRVM